MPRSPVQFQKGQSLAEFTDRYGSEEQCLGGPLPGTLAARLRVSRHMRAQIRCCRLRCRQCLANAPVAEHQVSLTASTVLREHQACR